MDADHYIWLIRYMVHKERDKPSSEAMVETGSGNRPDGAFAKPTVSTTTDARKDFSYVW